MIHTAVLVVAIATLPIMPGDEWKPESGERPMLLVLSVLAAAIGLPYFAISATAPLVQAWYARALPRGTPYRLYSLSNIGSLATLLSYPFIVERLFSTTQQSYIWSGLFGVFAACCGALAWYATRVRTHGVADPADAPLTPEEAKQLALERPLRNWHIALWLFYPALAVTALLALTNHLCRDVAVVPFLWIAPLTLYLLSFIICFDSDRWYSPRWWAIATAFCSALIVCLFVTDQLDAMMAWFAAQINRPEWEYEFRFEPSQYLHHMVIEGMIYLVWLFCACMLCHGELVRLKPPTRSLTVFYLCIATGGALGGLFVALVCPRIFEGYWEFNLVQIAIFLVAAIVIGWNGGRWWFRESRWLSIPLTIALGSLLVLEIWVHYKVVTTDRLIRLRNFYGVLTVTEENRTGDPKDTVYELYHGRILHGIQIRDPKRRREPTTYYMEGSGPALALQHLRERRGNIRIGVLGLGTGSISCWANEGDTICFYEINSNVLALQPKYFTYLKDCPAEVQVVMGDARIKMESQPPQNFDILFMDAFSGDAVPTHLLTVEAIDLYRKHLKPNGILAIHISNRFLLLDPVILGLVLHADMHYVKISKYDEDSPFEASSDWVLLSSSDELIKDKDLIERQTALEGDVPITWTDQYSNLFDVLR